MSFDKNLFDSNFTFAFKANVANTIRIATQAFDAFLSSNHSFLNNGEELYGRILAFAVKQQFLKSAPATADTYFVSKRDTNAFKANAVFLDTPDYVTNVCRTEKATKLPCKAAYKLKLAAANREYDTQMEFFLNPTTNQIEAGIPKKYAILGYRYSDGKLHHLNIMVPDSKFENILYSESLLNQINEYYHYVPEELVEDNVASLKQELIQIANKKQIII